MVEQKKYFYFAETNSPSGGIPDKIMKVTESKQLSLLASRSGQTAKQVSETLIAELQKRTIIDDVPENYGLTIADCVNRDIKLSEMVEALQAAGIPTISANYDAVMELVIIGDGECTECGGDMEETDGEHKQTGGFDYDSEPEFTPVWIEKTCKNCGHVESNEPDFDIERE